MSFDIEGYLRAAPLFQSLSSAALRRLAIQVGIETFSKDTPIIQRGQAGDCMFMLLEGEVRISLEDREDARKQVIHLGAGQIFGEMALLTRAPRSADVIASRDCRCLLFSRPAMEDLMRQNPEVARLLTAVLGERMLRSGKLPKVGKYRLLGEMARGGMAVVYEGFHPDLERPVAIKMLHHELVYHPQFGPRFRDEARLIAHLHHPHIVEVFDTEEAYATFFIIMEKLKGIDLKSAILTRGTLDYNAARSILRQLASALHFAHELGVIHRDVKPSNAMLSPEGDVKLMDFGIAVLPPSVSAMPEQYTPLGTPFYMSPEQHRAEVIDGRADIYALGVVAYAMLTGSVPFRGDLRQVYDQKEALGHLSVRQHDPEVPDDLEDFVRIATAFDPDARFGHGEDILQHLHHPEQSGFSLSSLKSKALTLAFPHGQKDAVARLLEECKEEARQWPEILVGHGGGR